MELELLVTVVHYKMDSGQTITSTACESWLQQSLDPVRRAQLVENNLHQDIVPRVLDAMHHVDHHITQQPSILHLVRLLRNLCAENAKVAQYMLDAGVIEALSSVAASSPSSVLQDNPSSIPLLKACAQLLCNAATSSPAAACGVWKATWPEAILGLLASIDGSCVEPVALITLQAAGAVGNTTLDDVTAMVGSITQTAGSKSAGRFWSMLLRHPAHTQALPEGVALLIQHVALSCGRLGGIIHCICPALLVASGDDAPQHEATREQQVQHQVQQQVQQEDEHQQQQQCVDGEAVQAVQAVQAVLEAVGHVAGSDVQECGVGRHAHVEDGEGQAACALAMCAARAAVWWGTATTRAAAVGEGCIEALHLCVAAALEALRVLLAHQHRDSATQHRVSSPQHSPARHLCTTQIPPQFHMTDSAHGLPSCTAVQMLLAMVGALPVVAHKGREGPALVMVPAVAAMAGMFPHQQPFPGYRTDVVAVLANVVYGDTYVQQVVVDEGGIEVLLSQCVIDDTSPMAKEWALLAIRNLCEGCPAAHERIKALQAQGVVETEEMRAAGIKMEVDPATGKLKVSTQVHDNGGDVL